MPVLSTANVRLVEETHDLVHLLTHAHLTIIVRMSLVWHLDEDVSLANWLRLVSSQASLPCFLLFLAGGRCVLATALMLA